jgi:hypothetical protein
VRVTGADWDRLGVEAERVAHFIGNRAYMRMNDGHCAALDVRVTADGTREFFCTVYEQRPQTCRDLNRGSPECEGELATKGMRLDRVKRQASQAGRIATVNAACSHRHSFPPEKTGGAPASVKSSAG